MAYSIEDKNKWFDYIITEIEAGSSLIKALQTNGSPSTSTFYIWLEEDEEKSKRYARACEVRELKILDEILEIADKQSDDIIHSDSGDVINHNVINRNRLQIDSRKWVLGKLNPKKYGDKIDHTTGGDKITPQPIPLILQDGRSYEDLKNELKPE